MADVFFSYKREDRHRVQLFCLELQKMGFEVAWDQKILTGEAWENWIFEQLMACKVVLVFWSRDSIQSEYVRNEARLAYKAKKLLPVFIDRLSAIEKARLIGFDGLQSTELFNWKGNLDDTAWQALVAGIERAITPTYVERQTARKNDELHTARLLRDTVVDRETTFEKQLVEAEQARLEATTRERKTALELVDIASKLKEMEAKAAQLEADARSVNKRHAQAQAAANEARDLLGESSSKLLRISKELSDERAAAKKLQANIPKTKQRAMRLMLVTMTSVAAGAIAMWAALPTPLVGSKPVGKGERALAACETLARDNSQTPLPSGELRAQIADCKSALSNWFKEVAQSTRPVIARFGEVRAQPGSGARVSEWIADVGTTLRTELSNSGLALVSDLAGLKRIEQDNEDLRRQLKQAAVSADHFGALKTENRQLLLELESRRKVDLADNCDRLAGDPFDEVQTAAGRPTRKEVGPDPGPAIRGCEEALKAVDEPRFRYQLGRALLAEKNRRALDELEVARRAGYVASATLLGWIYREGVFGGRNLIKALSYYKEAVERGDPAAMVQMAYIYRMEEFGVEDDAKAFSLYSLAARKQFPSAMLAVGEYYSEGTVVQKDCNQAIKSFGESAKLGNVKAIDSLLGIAKKGCR